MPRDPVALARDLLGAEPDSVRALLVWPDRATYAVTVGGRRFVVKTDDDPKTVAHEAAGQQRAAAAGVRVPELVAVTADALAMLWVDGVPLHKEASALAWQRAGAQIRIAHDLGGGPPFGTGFGGFNPERATWREFFEVFAEWMLAECERELDFPRDPAARIRARLRDAAPLLDTPNLAWCHGDFQPDHVLVDPETHQVTAIIDWADHGSGDIGWDVAVLTLDFDTDLEAFLDGYEATPEVRRAIGELVPLYRLARHVGEAGWLAEHGMPYAESISRAIELSR